MCSKNIHSIRIRNEPLGRNKLVIQTEMENLGPILVILGVSVPATFDYNTIKTYLIASLNVSLVIKYNLSLACSPNSFQSSSIASWLGLYKGKTMNLKIHNFRYMLDR